MLAKIFKHNKVNTFINITGLALGLSSALLVFVIVQHEYSFNAAWKNKEKIYRIVSSMELSGGISKSGGAPGPLGEAIRSSSSAVSHVSSAWLIHDQRVTVPNNQDRVIYKKQHSIAYVEPSFFSIFEYHWLQGNAATALSAPNQVVLTKSRADFYFPGADPGSLIGRMIVYDDTMRLSISGIVENPVQPTDINFEEFVSFSTFLKSGLGEGSWNMWGALSDRVPLFVKLNDKAGLSSFQKTLDVLQKTDRGLPLKVTYDAQALSDIHFNPEYATFGLRQANRNTMLGLISVGIFLLLLGCLNFINLATSQSIARAKEVGIRKTLGSSRARLIWQFMSETLVLTVIAAVVSIIVVSSALPHLSEFIAGTITPDLFYTSKFWLALSFLIVIVGFLAGLYPALVLSRFNIIGVFRGHGRISNSPERSASLKRSITVFQFVIAQFFIICTLFVTSQLNFISRRDLGFKQKGVLTFNVPLRYDSTDSRKYVLKQKLEALPAVGNVSLSSDAVISNKVNADELKFNTGKQTINFFAETKWADTAFLDLYGIRLVAGRNFSQSDTVREVVINESLAKKLGAKNLKDALGYTMEKNWNPKVRVTGIVSDFHTQSLYGKIQPLVIGSFGIVHSKFHVTISETGDGENQNQSLSKIQDEFLKIYPDAEFEYSFLQDQLYEYYRNERNLSSLLFTATVISIIISCLGIFGLVLYTTNRRLKEISIRKILGASPVKIISLISLEFVLLTMLSSLIAIPFAYYFLADWLNNFAFRVTLSWPLFAAGALILLVITFMTLAYQTFKVSYANPVANLKED